MVKLSELLNHTAVSGEEKEFSDFLFMYLLKQGYEPYQDPMGNVVVGGNKPDILFLAHLDEVGARITGILNNGLVCANTLGGIDINNYYNRIVKIKGRCGNINGVVIHTLKEEKKRNTGLFIDIGTRDIKSSMKFVDIGDVIECKNNCIILSENYIAGSGLDNKVGVYILLNLMEHVKKRNITFAFSTGEETTKNGARYIAANLKPQRSIIVDATPVNNNPGIYSCIELNNGPVVCYSPIIDGNYNKKLIDIASKSNIKLQKECMNDWTHTDADVMSASGHLCTMLSYPIENMHSFSEMCSFKDIDNCITILIKLIEGINW